jgi:predicted DsbA family dithiol-disulfide isomerase
VTVLPFDLHPEYPREGIPRSELDARYGGLFHERLKAQFAAGGLVYAPPAEVVPNSGKALRLTELARDRGLHAEVHDRLMDAYWTESEDVGNDDVLRRLTTEAGLDPGEVDRVFAGDEYAERVRASTAEAQTIGIHGIPAFLLGGRLLVLGAQPHEVFERALEQLGTPT